MARRPLGAMLLESGRITEDDVERVLAYQRAHGGFFGQALVALGILTREETDWALANHFDLPFIFPNAEAVDPDVAHLAKLDRAPGANVFCHGNPPPECYALAREGRT